MKRLLLLLAASIAARAQGTINFANVGAGLNAPVIGIDGTTRLAGTGFTAELLVGQDANSLTPVAGTTTFLTGANAGYFVGGTKVLPGFAPGTNPFFQVRYWDNQGGTVTSYAAAAIYGASTVFQLSNLSGNTLGDPNGSPPTPPGTLIGLVTPPALIPEPSTVALLLSGTALLWLLRRR